MKKSRKRTLHNAHKESPLRARGLRRSKKFRAKLCAKFAVRTLPFGVFVFYVDVASLPVSD